MPSDVADAVEQDKIAESLMSDPTPEAEQPEVEQAESQEAEPLEELQEPEQEESDEYLPTEDEKVFPDEVLMKYLQRYRKDENWLADPLNKQLLVDKINSDLEWQKQKQAQQEIEEEPAQPKPEPTQQQVSMQDWLKQVDQVAEKYVHPDVANAFTANFLKAFGVKEAPTPETSKALGHVFTAGVINVLNSVLPDLLSTPMGTGKSFFQNIMEQSYEGFADNYESSMYSNAWQKATAEFKDLPAWNAPGSDQLRMQAAEEIAGSVEEFDALQFKGKDGKPLSEYQNSVKKYSLLAKHMAGQRLTPKEAKSFVEAGQRVARKQQIQRQAGNLGSGKSNGQFTQTSNANDDIFKEGMELYKREHGTI